MHTWYYQGRFREQHRALVAEREKTKKAIGVISICAGDGIANIFKELTIDEVIEGGQTMNPSVEDILTAVEKINIVLPSRPMISPSDISKPSRLVLRTALVTSPHFKSAKDDVISLTLSSTLWFTSKANAALIPWRSELFRRTASLLLLNIRRIIRLKYRIFDIIYTYR